MCMSTAATALGLITATVIDWCKYLHKECTAKLLHLPHEEKLMGGDGLIVEIDESLIIKQKYNCGRMRQQHQQWVFGLYHCQTEKGWIQFVQRRDEATLLPLIQQFVHPGSTVYSNVWAANNNIGQHEYLHGVVVHEENFVKPMSGVHAQGIEAYWSKAEHKIKDLYGCRMPLKNCNTKIPTTETLIHPMRDEEETQTSLLILPKKYKHCYHLHYMLQ